MSMYVDNTSVAGGQEEVKQGTKKCGRVEVEMKLKYSLRKTKYMVIMTSKKEDDISEQVKTGNIQRAKK